ncbi:uncharacterized protein LOC143619537 [Bidens hawaiensis]|uniref:uncharacterized protein LOC143619537 n=1 Tax=Bidens hawaiensis TaxID=980011 RepID=UPI00404A49CB
MADLHEEEEDDDLHHVPPSISPQNNNLHQFIMNHHRLQQSQSQSQSQPHSHRTTVIQDNNNNNVDDHIEFDPDFEPGSGLGFLLDNSDNPNFHDHNNNNNNSGFLIADCTNSSQLSGLRIIDIASDDSDQAPETDIDEDAIFPFRWDVFRLEDEIPIPNPNSNANLNAYEDFEWEEVDDDDDDNNDDDDDDDDALVSPMLLTAFEDPNEEPDAVEWQVLSNVHNFDTDPDPEEDLYEDYNYTEYEMFFGQFADGDAPLSGRPPASKAVVDNLSTVVTSQEHVCAVCKDEVVVGELVTQLPCGHGYHGGCILPWLAVRNTCPVCRHELPTDDVDYERRKVERGGNA